MPEIAQGLAPADTLAIALDAARRDYPRAAELAETLHERAPRVFDQMLRFSLDQRPEFWPHAERLVRLAEALGDHPADSLIEYTVAFLKEQVRFIKSGSYSHSEFDDVLEQVYDNAEVMQGYYLDGLLLTYAFWPIQLDLHRFFQREFLTRLPKHGVGTEVGFGHGLYLLDTLRSEPGLRARGFDISDYSRQYAARLLEQGGIAPSRFELSLADARGRLPIEDASCDWFIFAEILEHIPDPEGALRDVYRVVKPRAPVFLTTVMNSNAIDHLYLYTEIDQIRQQVLRAGFEIIAEQTLAVADYSPGSRDPSSDVAVICQRPA
jgi:ubiquinone/menaquinone biosynthesis C-methylase UbiE